MDTTSIQTLNLNEKDFQLMIDGLEHLPNRYLTGEIISELLIESRAKGDQAELEK